MNLSDLECRMILSMAGHNVAIPWGAAAGAALEYLVNNGYVHRDTSGDVYTYLLTQKGIDLASKLENGNAD